MKRASFACLMFVAVSATAADVKYERFEVPLLDPIDGLSIRGRIEKGDAAHLRSLIGADKERFFLYGGQILLDSPGGNFDEALQLAEIIRKYPSWIYVDRICASACFLLYAAAAARGQHFVTDRSIGVHRPFYDRAHFAQLSMAEAESAHRHLTDRAVAYFRHVSVPEPIIEKMMRTPSTAISWLTSQEISLLGTNPAWFLELLLARCGLADREKPRSQREQLAFARALGECTTKVIFDERERALFGQSGSNEKRR